APCPCWSWGGARSLVASCEIFQHIARRFVRASQMIDHALGLFDHVAAEGGVAGCDVGARAIERRAHVGEILRGSADSFTEGRKRHLDSRRGGLVHVRGEFNTRAACSLVVTAPRACARLDYFSASAVSC